MSTTTLSDNITWKRWQLIGFRIAFVFFVLMCTPQEWEWYKHLFTLNWTDLHYRDFHDIARISPDFVTINTVSGRWGIASWADWGVAFLIALGAGLIWSIFDAKRKEYNVLYYWLRVLVRYRAGIGIIGFGYTKVFPVQMPYPSINLLNNDFGDLTGHKIFWLSIGIVPWYQVFTGIVEVAAGVMLFFRSTTALGAALLIGTLLSITVVNLAYDGGVHVYASYFVLLGAFIFAHYVPSIYNLLIRERFTKPFNYFPSFSTPWQKYVRIGLKSVLIFVFIILLTYLQWMNFLYDPYKQPSMAGLPALHGYYDVTEFRLNGKPIPYSPLDTVRWQEATFEKWTTLTYKVNRPVQLDLSNGGGDPMRDINRTFEVSGVAGGRRVFYYEADTINKVLYLQDKNVATTRTSVGPGRGDGSDRANKVEVYPKDWIPEEALKNIGNENEKIHERARSARRTRALQPGSPEMADKKRDKMILHYTADDGSRVILSGTNENKDSIYVVLDRVDRKYALSENKVSAGKYH